MWKLLQSRVFPDDKAAKLYGHVVAQARQPAFYARLAIPDTPEGRYELIVLHLCLAVERLRRIGPDGHKLARAVNERFIVDLDDNMREMGVGDLTVPKKVKRAAAGLLERAENYQTAIATGDRAAVRAALAEHVLLDEKSDTGFDELAAYVETAHRTLTTLSDRDVLAGQIAYPPIV